MNSQLYLERRRNRPKSPSFIHRSCISQVSMPERLFAIAVPGNDMAVTEKFVLVSCQTLETNWPTRVQLAGADSQLSAQAITKAVSKTRRGILIDPCGIDFGHEIRGRVGVFSNDRLRMSGTVAIDMCQRLLSARNYLDGNDEIRILGSPILFADAGNVLCLGQRHGPRAAAHLDAFGPEARDHLG